MSKMIGALLCIFALSFAALPAAHGMGHDHGPVSMTMEDDRSKESSGSDHDELEECTVLPGHCSYTALMLDAEIAAALYLTATSTYLFDDNSTSKFRPETELRPPRV